MDRRCFISHIGRATAAGGTLLPLVGCGIGGEVPPSEGGVDIPANLGAAIAHLVDPEYRNYALQSSQSSLYQALVDKGVVTTAGEFDEQAVFAAAQTDALVEYGGFYHTETELQLYGLAYSLVLDPPAA